MRLNAFLSMYNSTQTCHATSTENPVAYVEIDEPEDGVDYPGVSQYPYISLAVLAIVKKLRESFTFCFSVIKYYVEVHQQQVERSGADEKDRSGCIDIESVPVAAGQYRALGLYLPTQVSPSDLL